MEKEIETEEWRAAVGFEGEYEVSSFGNIRSLDRYVEVKPNSRRPEGGRTLKKGGDLKPGLSSNGYLTVSMNRQSYCVQYIVATTFIGPKPDGKLVLHGDGVRTNNRRSNLRYGTHKENCADMVGHGTRIIGSMAVRAKLNEKTAALAMAMHGRWSQSEIAAALNVSPAAIQAVHDGRTWTHCKRLSIEEILSASVDADLEIWN